jgi:hypothetical protein
MQPRKQNIIHARISETTRKEIEFLKVELGLEQTTAVIEFALHHIVSEYKKKIKRQSPFDILFGMDLIGSNDMDPDLSENYKKAIKKGLIKKHTGKKAKKIGKKK